MKIFWLRLLPCSYALWDQSWFKSIWEMDLNLCMNCSMLRTILARPLCLLTKLMWWVAIITIQPVEECMRFNVPCWNCSTSWMDLMKGRCQGYHGNESYWIIGSCAHPSGLDWLKDWIPDSKTKWHFSWHWQMMSIWRSLSCWKMSCQEQTLRLFVWSLVCWHCKSIEWRYVRRTLTRQRKGTILQEGKYSWGSLSINYNVDSHSDEVVWFDHGQGCKALSILVMHCSHIISGRVNKSQHVLKNKNVIMII